MKFRTAILSLSLIGGFIASPIAPSGIVPEAHARDLVSGERVRVKKLTRDIKNVQNNLITTGPSHFQSAAEVEKYKKRFNQFNQALTKYPQVNDPDVAAARTAYKSLADALTAEFGRAKKQLAELGNVQARLKLIESNARKYAVPAPLTPPFSAADAQTWLKASSEARTVAEHNKKELAKIAPIAFLPKNRGTVQSGAPYDSDDVKRLSRWADKMFADVQNGYKQTANALDARMKYIEEQFDTRWQEDPESDKRWLFLDPSQEKEVGEFYEEGKALAKSSKVLEGALGRSAERADTFLDKIEAAKTAFDAKKDIALKTSRLPKPKSKDRKRIKLAKKIMEIPRYEFGEYGPIVLTTKKITEHERKDSEKNFTDAEFHLNGDITLKGTETTWTYKWKEFKFATPIRDADGKWYIWWITARNYSSGSSVTPMNQWISGKATMGNQILKKNF